MLPTQRLTTNANRHSLHLPLQNASCMALHGSSFETDMALNGFSFEIDWLFLTFHLNDVE